MLVWLEALSVFWQSNKEDASEKLSSTLGTPKTRKRIRKIIDDKNLCAETQEALKEEEERCKRLADREQQMRDRREVLHTQQPELTLGCTVLSNDGFEFWWATSATSESFFFADISNQEAKMQYFKARAFSLQVTVIEDELSQVVCPVTIKLVLDQDQETKEPVVQVHRNLVTILKPHQVDG